MKEADLSVDTSALTKEMMGIFPLLFKTVFHSVSGCETSLPPTQMQALLSLSISTSMNMTQLAARLMISKQQLTKVVEALVDKKLVCRRESNTNRRLVLLELTEDGKAFLQSQLRHKEASVKTFLDLLTEEEQETILSAFHILRRTLKQLDIEAIYPNK